MAAAAFFYFVQPVESRNFLFSFLVLVFYPWAIIDFLGNFEATFALSVVSGVAFFFLLGVKDFVFIRREKIFNVLSGYFYFLSAAGFFIADKTGWGKLVFYPLTFAVFWGLSEEFIKLSVPDLPKNKKNLIVAGLAFLIIELAAIVDLLPIGFLNASALILLFVFIMEDFLFYHLKGGLNRGIILNNITILIVAAIIIFATSKWAL